MKTNLHDLIEPQGIYTGAQVISITDIPSSTFYLYVKQNKIPKHVRNIDGRTVFLGHELLAALTSITRKLPEIYFVKPQRGRPSQRKCI